MKRAAVIIGVLLATGNVSLLAAPQTPTSSNPTEYIVGENSGLKVVLRIKSPASLADNDWLQMEILNSGPPGVIKSARIQAPAQVGGGSSSNIFGLTTLGIFADGRRTLLAGPFTTIEPSVWAAASLGLHRENVNVTMRLTFELTLADGRSISVSMGEPAAFTWSPPDAGQMKAVQQQAVALLAKATSGTPLSSAETAFLSTLLAKPETAAAVTLEQALAMLRIRQFNNIYEFGEVLGLVQSQWPGDPAVIAFFHEAFATRGTAALSDLARGGPWDDSFIEPIVKLIEGGFPPQGARPGVPPTDKVTHLRNALIVMDRNYASWSQNVSMAPRLGKAALRILQPLTTSTVGVPSIYNQVNLLVLTHDPAMIDVLRPFLSDQTIDQFTVLSSSMPSGVTPMRYSDVAANGILGLLGEPPLVDSWLRAKAPSTGPYPEWDQWDRKIAALQQRLNARSRQ